MHQTCNSQREVEIILPIKRKCNLVVKWNRSITYLYKPKQDQNSIKYTLQLFFWCPFIASSKFLIKKLCNQFRRSVLLSWNKHGTHYLRGTYRTQKKNLNYSTKNGKLIYNRLQVNKIRGKIVCYFWKLEDFGCGNYQHTQNEYLF